MFLSRVEIDVNNKEKMKDLRHLGCYHAWIEDSFPEEREKAKELRTRKLWRVDRIADKYYLLLSSETEPDLKSLEKYGVEGSASTKNYNKLIDSIHVGTKARFKIKLNAVKAIVESTKGGLINRIVPVPQNELYNFFIDRTEKNGFKVKDGEYSIVSRSSDPLIKENPKNDISKIFVVGATYEGLLEVTDVDKFIHSLTKGIGRKKAYGYGMLTIYPIN